VLFDFDGTLTDPGALDFAAIREAVGCPPGELILEYLESLDDPVEKAHKYSLLDAFEAIAAADSAPAREAEAVVAGLRGLGIPVGIVSRNSRSAIDRALENFPRLSPLDFDVIVPREAPVRPKPAPDSVLFAAAELGVDPGRVLFVGDNELDVEAGSAAGTSTVLVRPEQSAPLEVTAGPGLAGRDVPAVPHFVVDHLGEVPQIVRMGRPLPLGKFPNDLLAQYLDGAVDPDPALLVEPAVGEDVAAVDVRGEEVVVLKTDPITFATDALGEYVVLVNANDIATSGATPRWLLATALFPAGSTPSEVVHVLRDLASACRRHGVSLCGGHTEITDAVTRPLVVGTMAGTVRRAALLDKRGMRAGDRVLLTKGVAVEGTAIIAREMGERLTEMGMSQNEVDACRDLLDRIGILREAEVARAHAGVSAMHDVTEGGLATALRELGTAGGRIIDVEIDAIPILAQTSRVCDLLGLDPLGLIGSGSLLICCADAHHADLMAELHLAGIEVACIGGVRETGVGVRASRGGVATDWPFFEVDEIARLFQQGIADSSTSTSR